MSDKFVKFVPGPGFSSWLFPQDKYGVEGPFLCFTLFIIYSSNEDESK